MAQGWVGLDSVGMGWVLVGSWDGSVRQLSCGMAQGGQEDVSVQMPGF